MIVIDTSGNPLEAYDLQAGHIVEGRKTIHHEAVEGVTEQGHYEIIREYPETGGKDVHWVVDVPGVMGCQEWDEEVPVGVYMPYTTEEVSTMAASEPTPTIEQRTAALETATQQQAEALNEVVTILEAIV